MHPQEQGTAGASRAVGTVHFMRDEELVYQHDTPFDIMLQDGSQLDGVLARCDGYVAAGRAKFAAWQVDDAFVDCGSDFTLVSLLVSLRPLARAKYLRRAR
jgi:hypothetical protein